MGISHGRCIFPLLVLSAVNACTAASDLPSSCQAQGRCGEKVDLSVSLFQRELEHEFDAQQEAGGLSAHDHSIAADDSSFLQTSRPSRYKASVDGQQHISAHDVGKKSSMLQDASAKRTKDRHRRSSHSAPPNIVIFHPDDMFANTLDWDGFGLADYAPTLPPDEALPVATGLMTNFAKVVSEGATFTKAYTASSKCSPSRAALLTGRYPSRNEYAEWYTRDAMGDGVDTFIGSTSEKMPLVGEDASHNLPAVLQARGYTTGMVGKWHLSHKNESGGDYRSDYTDQQSNVKEKGFDFADGLYINNLHLAEIEVNATFGHHLEWLLEKALEFMDGAITANTPFFLYFNPTVPHEPDVEASLDGTLSEYETPAGTLSTLPDLTQYCYSCVMLDRASIWRASSGVGGPSDRVPSDRSTVSSLYWLDQGLGVIYDYLSEHSELNSTYIIVLSDNGYGYAKGTVQELGCRTSLFIRGPDVEAGTVITDLVSNIDIAPTVLDWAGGDSSQLDTDGVSLTSLLSRSLSQLSRKEIFLEMSYDRAVVTADGLKYHSIPTSARLSNNIVSSDTASHYPSWGEADQLYDLTTDGAEQTNLVANPSYADRLSAVQALLAAHKASTLNAPVLPLSRA